MTDRFHIADITRKTLGVVEARYIGFLTILIVTGVVLRLALIGLTTSPADPLNKLYPGFTDGEDYMEIARSLVTTGVFGYAGRPTAFRPPVYPVIIAAMWKVFGETLTPVRLFQVFLFVVMTIAYSSITRKFFGVCAGMLTALVFSVYPLFVFMTTEIATECLYMTIASLVFVLTVTTLNTKQRGKIAIEAFAIGILCGLGTLTRTNMIFIFILIQMLMIWIAFREGKRSRCVVFSIALWIGHFAVVAPWVIRNHAQFGAPILATNLDYNLFRGTFDLAGGPPFGPALVGVFGTHNVMYEDEIENPRIIQLRISEVNNEQNARRAAIDFIRSDPISWVKERCRNFIYLWLNLQWDSELLTKHPLVIVASVLVTIVYFVLLALAVTGTVANWNSRGTYQEKQFLLILWLFILAAIPVISTFVGKRYRVAMIDPYLAILSCIGIRSWLNRLMNSKIIKSANL